jgi:hypothetical protein
MLEDNSYIRVLFIDHWRAVDTINHELLTCKLMTFDVPSNVARWIANFLILAALKPFRLMANCHFGCQLLKVLSKVLALDVCYTQLLFRILNYFLLVMFCASMLMMKLY